MNNQPSWRMIRVLDNLANGRAADKYLTPKTVPITLKALQRRGLVDWEGKITGIGREVLEKFRK